MPVTASRAGVARRAKPQAKGEAGLTTPRQNYLAENYALASHFFPRSTHFNNCERGTQSSWHPIIGDLLAELSFDTKVTEDVVTARRTSLKHQDVEQDLRVVGYLLMPTRQLEFSLPLLCSRRVESGAVQPRGEISGLVDRAGETGVV
jgi:hypothetical protein